MIRFFCLIISLILFINSFANSDIDFKSIKVKYSKYNAVVTNEEFYYLFDVVDDSISVVQENSKEVLILNEHSKAYTNDYLYYSSFSSITNKEAYTLVPTLKGYDKIVVKQFSESHDRDGSVFYDDSKSIQFSYPSLREGAIASLKYNINYSNPHFLRQSYLQSYIPTLKSKVIVKIHKDIDVGYKIFNRQNVNISFKEYTKGKYKFYEWEVGDVMPFMYGGSKYFSIKYYSPHVVLFVRETNINGVSRKYFGNVDDLYRFNWGFIDKLNLTHSDELDQKVTELTSGLSDVEKAKAIYYWVQDNIKYVAYEQGLMGFVPSSATEVYLKRYGDCKGMSSLITEMMNMAGLKASLSWVGTRHIPYKYEELPLPSVDNHMVASLFIGDSILILDGTFRYLDYGIYPYHIQGKEVLVSIDREKYEIFKVPVSFANYSVSIDSLDISINNNQITGSGKMIRFGFNKGELAYAMDGVKNEDYNKRLAEILNLGNNKFNVENSNIINLFERDQPAKIEYDFIIHDYLKTIGDEIYVNLNVDKSYQKLIVDTTGTYSPIENDFYCNEKNITSFKIPKGFEVSYIPQNDSFKNNQFGYSIQYKKVDDCIIMEKEMVFEFFVIEGEQLAKWNQMIKQLNRQYQASIVLKKIN